MSVRNPVQRWCLVLAYLSAIGTSQRAHDHHADHADADRPIVAPHVEPGPSFQGPDHEWASEPHELCVSCLFQSSHQACLAVASRPMPASAPASIGVPCPLAADAAGQGLSCRGPPRA